MLARTGRAIAALVLITGAAGACTQSHTAATCASVLRTITPVTKTAERAATGPVLEIAAENAAFDPTCVTHVPQGTVTLHVQNIGKVVHNVAIPIQHIDVDVAAGTSVTIRVRIGTEPVVYVCKYHRTLGMVGVLIPQSSA